jgi:transaldolase
MPVPAITPAPLAALAEAGVAVWLDDLSRPLVREGGLADLVATRGVVGVTTNPSIFAAAVDGTDAYDEQLDALAREGVELDEAVLRLTTDDVREACDVLAGASAGPGTPGGDGRVSIEVDPRLAHDTDATVEAARTLWSTVDRPNLYIKIPATREGLSAITQVLAEGISVNVTLIFSLERYGDVLAAHAEGLERAAAAGHDLAGIASVASFFVSRVDTAIDKQLDAAAGERAHALRGRAAVANARLAFEQFERFAGSERWQTLAARGAQAQRPLWASTGAKDPAYRDTVYVEELVAPGTVNTMPRATLEAVADHGEIRPGSIAAYDDARAVLAGLDEAGIDLAAVTETLEAEGVTKFVDAWSQFLATVRTALEARA